MIVGASRKITIEFCIIEILTIKYSIWGTWPSYTSGLTVTLISCFQECQLIVKQVVTSLPVPIADITNPSQSFFPLNSGLLSTQHPKQFTNRYRHMSWNVLAILKLEEKRWLKPTSLLYILPNPKRSHQRRSQSRLSPGEIPWRREWLPTPVFLPGEFLGWRSLAGYSPWVHKESYMTEQLTLHLTPWLCKYSGADLCSQGYKIVIILQC